MTNSLSFCLTQSVSICPSFLKDIFAGYRIIGWLVISLWALWKNVIPLYFGFCGLCHNIYHHLYYVPECLFTLGVFEIFSLPLIFSSLTMICLAVIFFVFILSWICWAHWKSDLISFICFGNFSAITSSNSDSVSCSLCFFWDSSYSCWAFWFCFLLRLCFFWNSNYTFVGLIYFVPHFPCILLFFFFFL